ncbi:hypothetical protein JAAARDRAFT_43073 [Jaapia argillacea MUCL 33604]|uniref:Uncharacterized protein n=1 Tax=Jaapia argillacea MUCL 33604 TaxID=933084 RepID=A0A067PDP9_9AGAM|nr:hypothetical protein JAAARDRAFT_43073 [Jaapia argillacea MUCL 33604]
MKRPLEDSSFKLTDPHTNGGLVKVNRRCERSSAVLDNQEGQLDVRGTSESLGCEDGRRALGSFGWGCESRWSIYPPMKEHIVVEFLTSPCPEAAPPNKRNEV